MNNVSVLIQSCCLCCVHQVVCFANTCNVMNVHQCNYCCLLNKLCCSVSSMQDVEKSLMSKRFHSASTSSSTIFFINIITLTIKQWARVIIITTLHFMMWCREPSSVSFKLIKSPLWSMIRLHLWCICMSQL